ncbi:APC family permease [Enteractinococcus coprophilus]|uniref:Amino acid/polyamine/organocation transporter (APC superfamily) n=1 Tax=Enteractinococcus coprophilus TaxID=1027633 RepID=A0A543AND6_9MICC|nr:APC family permease [Enteractinococcus coprophilus]TQL74100.1 amino acid/polyamine/organocation transporter (APC superfamily) [Enteractinococcus coprophilus]
MTKAVNQQTEQISLAKTLSNKDVLALGFGAMIGFGWVVLTKGWLLDAGPGGASLAFLVGGIIMAFVGLVYAELTSAMPKAGGAHNFILRARGPHGAFIGSWGFIGGYVTIIAFEAVAVPNTIEYIWPNINHVPFWTIAGFEVHLTWALIGVVTAIVLTWINIRGTKVAGMVQTFVVLFLLLVGIMLITGAFTGGEARNLEPLFTPGVTGFFAVMIAVPFLFVGFDVIPQSAEEANVPPRQVGRLVVISVIMATLWYIMVIFASVLGLSGEQLVNSHLATADAVFNMFNSQAAANILIAGGLAGILTTWNSLLIGASRMIYALSRTGMLPKRLAKLHPVYKTPVNALLMLGAISAVAPFFGSAMLDWLVESGSPMIVITYMLVSVSFVILRRREPQMPRPLRVGGKGRGGELIGWFAIILTIALLIQYLPGMPAQLSWQPWVIFLAWWVAGAFFYYRLPRGIRAGEDVEERLIRAVQERERQRITSARVEKH